MARAWHLNNRSVALVSLALALSCGRADDVGKPVETRRQALQTLVVEALLPSRDAHVMKAERDRNDGAAETLVVRGSGNDEQGTLVAFDMPDSRIEVDRATLVLTLRPDKPPVDWSPKPGELLARPIFKAWAEGNGVSGSGVTWSCPVDSNIANQEMNCSPPPWNGGYPTQLPIQNQKPSSPPVVIVNGQMGQIVFDVTEDVRSGVKSWLISALHSRGQAAFYSREGAAVASDASLAPKLVLENPVPATNPGPDGGTSLSPVLECVADLPNRGLAAVWGYNNPQRKTIRLKVSSEDNSFSPEPADRGQPQSFKSGRHRGVLVTPFTGKLAWTLNGRVAQASGTSKLCSTTTQGSDGDRTVTATLGDGTEVRVFDEAQQFQQCDREHAACTAACSSDGNPARCLSNCDALRTGCRYWYDPQGLAYQRCFTWCERQEVAACPGSLTALDCIHGCRHGTLHTACQEPWQDLTRCWEHAVGDIECDPLSGAPFIPACRDQATAEVSCIGGNPL